MTRPRRTSGAAPAPPPTRPKRGGGAAESDNGGGGLATATSHRSRVRSGTAEGTAEARPPRARPARTTGAGGLVLTGEYSSPDFVRFCAGLTTDAGTPLEVERFQREMLRPHFAGASETVIIIPKGNGKTTLLSALALYHLDRVFEPQVVIVATSREQARTLFNQAARTVERSGLSERFIVKGGYGKIWLPGGNYTSPCIEVRAAEARRIDGAIPTLVLVDELHEHPTLDLYHRLQGGLSKKAGASLVAISTAGLALDSPLGHLREAFSKMPTFRRDHVRKRSSATSETGRKVMFEWSLDAEDDHADMRVVKKANPASWLTPEALADQFASPATQVGPWRRLHCGIWNEGNEPWIEPRIWDELARPAESIAEGSRVVVGLDLNLVRADTALTILSEDRRAEALIFPPPVELLQIEDEIRRLAERYRVEWFVYDPTNFRRSAEVLEGEGLPMWEYPQTPVGMADASATLLRFVQDRALTHSGDGAFRAHVLAGTTKDTERGWRLAKDPRTRRSIAALIALAMACAVSEAETRSGEPMFAFG